jgi:AraC-like DNA-binding protein
VGYKPAAVSYYWLHCIFENLEELDEEEAEIFQKQNDNPDILLIPMYFKLKKTENIVILLNQLIHYIINNHRNPIIPYLSKAVLIELCNQQHYYESEIDHKNRRFLEVVAYINAHFKEPINISELAAQFGYNEKYLVRLFRKNYQITIKDFINQTRLRYAERILLETSDPVKKIADKACYSDAYYFMRLFKKFYGISPTQYRNAYYNQNYTKYEGH